MEGDCWDSNVPVLAAAGTRCGEFRAERSGGVEG